MLIASAFVGLVLLVVVAPGAFILQIKSLIGAEASKSRPVAPEPPVAGMPTNTSSEQAQKQVLEILERPEFSRWKPQPREERKTVLDGSMSQRVLIFFKMCGEAISKVWSSISGPVGRFFHMIGEWLSKLLPKSTPTFSNAPTGHSGFGNFDYAFILRMIGWLLLAIVVFTLAALIFKRARFGPRQGRSARVLSREQVRSAMETGEALALEGHEWVAQAEKLLAEKDLRAVYRALYLGMLAGLHSAGKIDFRQTRTNWFYVRRFNGADSERSVFSELTELFDDVWYGNRTGRIDEVSSVKAKVASLVGSRSGADSPSSTGSVRKGGRR